MSNQRIVGLNSIDHCAPAYNQGYEEGITKGMRMALSSYRRLRRHPQALDYEDLLRAAIKRRKGKR